MEFIASNLNMFPVFSVQGCCYRYIESHSLCSNDDLKEAQRNKLMDTMKSTLNFLERIH